MQKQRGPHSQSSLQLAQYMSMIWARAEQKTHLCHIGLQLHGRNYHKSRLELQHPRLLGSAAYILLPVILERPFEVLKAIPHMFYVFNWTQLLNNILSLSHLRFPSCKLVSLYFSNLPWQWMTCAGTDSKERNVVADSLLFPMTGRSRKLYRRRSPQYS